MRAVLIQNGGKRNRWRMEQGGAKGGMAAAAQRERALAMWKVLRHNGKMDTLAANKLMRWVCETSEDIKDFIAGESALAMLAETDGVVEDGQDMIAPDAESYGNLVQQLQR